MATGSATTIFTGSLPSPLKSTNTALPSTRHMNSILRICSVMILLLYSRANIYETACSEIHAIHATINRDGIPTDVKDGENCVAECRYPSMKCFTSLVTINL